MKFLLAQPAQLRFQWELDVVLTNILSLKADAEIVCLFASEDRNSQGVFDHISSRYPTVECHMYEDTRADKSYAPTVRPFLWYCYLSEDKQRETETYFQIDADIIFRELPDFTKIPVSEKVWYGSDCGGYIDYEYLRTRQKGDYIVDSFSELLEVPRYAIEMTPGAGAQWLMKNPTADYWLKVYNDCNRLWKFLQGVDSDIQKWTAEMWAQLYNAPAFGIEQHISKELDFCRPTDPVQMWGMTKILHNAGVVDEGASSLFYKGKYVDHTPFGENFDWVRRDHCSIYYVEAIKKVAL